MPSPRTHVQIKWKTIPIYKIPSTASISAAASRRMLNYKSDDDFTKTTFERTFISYVHYILLVVKRLRRTESKQFLIVDNQYIERSDLYPHKYEAFGLMLLTIDLLFLMLKVSILSLL